MSLLRLFGIGCRSTMTQGSKTSGIITDVYTCWWLRVNTQAVRIGLNDTARYPYIITFAYTVDGTEYRGRRFVGPASDRPQEGQKITVYYETQNPGKYAVKL